MIKLNSLIFNYFFKNLFLKKSITLKNKDKIKKFDIYFKIANNNSVVTICYKKNIIFWQTCRMFKGVNFKKYSLISLFSLCNSSILFLKKLKTNMRVNLLFSGLSKFRKPIVKVFFKNKIFIKTILEIKFLSHNGIRTRKKKRLAKKRMRKMFRYSEFKNLKKSKKDMFDLSYKSINFFFLQELFYKLNFFFYLHFLKICITKKHSSISLLRSSHNYGKTRQSFSYIIFNKNLSFYVNSS